MAQQAIARAQLYATLPVDLPVDLHVALHVAVTCQVPEHPEHRQEGFGFYDSGSDDEEHSKKHRLFF